VNGRIGAVIGYGEVELVVTVVVSECDGAGNEPNGIILRVSEGAVAVAGEAVTERA
jgi:hypothetical protein